MEDMKQFLKPPDKEQIRLLLAITIFHTKPCHISLQDYLTNLRLQVFSRRQANQVDLGDYTPLSETEDLRGLVGVLMRRVEALEWEREEERERKRLRVEVKIEDEEEEEEEW